MKENDVASHEIGVRKIWRQIETALSLIGILMLAAYAGARMGTEFSSRVALKTFGRLHATDSGTSEKFSQKVDFTLWNLKRIRAYRESLKDKTSPVIAVLLIPKIHLEVPVFDGTDDLILNRGAGRIRGTAKIGARGNIGIAGHRDRFFRGLKDVRPSDSIALVTPASVIRFVVDRTEVVRPEDVRVLEDAGLPSLTLVTCFPFYFVGNAPERFIVRACATDFDGPNGPPITLAGQIQSEGEPK